MSEFKPGDRVMLLGYPDGAIVVRVNMVELAVGGHGGAYADPSELTPADPVPDAAVMLVRELIAQEYEARGNSDIGASCRAGRYDNVEEETAFAKYIRANSLTVERVGAAFRRAAAENHRADAIIISIHAALTEPRA